MTKAPPCVRCGQRKDAHQLDGECISQYEAPQQCAANHASDPPQDCDAPFCGCNPAWSDCIQMLQECGWNPPATGEIVNSPWQMSELELIREVIRLRGSPAQREAK